MQFSRRHFLSTLTFAGVCQFSFQGAFAEEPQPEVSKIRLQSNPPAVCIAPQYVAGEMLRAEGFNEIEYVQSVAGAQLAADIAGGKIDFSMQYAGPNIIGIDAGQPLVNLAGVQVGCFELFAQEGIKKLSDLKGKQVGNTGIGFKPACLFSYDTYSYRPGPQKRHKLGHRYLSDPRRAFRESQG